MNYLYDIIIQSLIFIYDILYTLLYRMFEHPVIAIIAMSVVINFIVLPLYQNESMEDTKNCGIMDLPQMSRPA